MGSSYRGSRLAYQDIPMADLVHRRKALLARKVDPNARIPYRAHELAAGYDLFALEDVAVPVMPSDPVAVRCGVAVALPLGHVGIVVPKPAVAIHGILLLLPIVEPDERREIILPVVACRSYRKIYAGEPFAELVVVPYSMSGSRPVEVLPAPGEPR